MRPLEILSALPQWAKAKPDAILDSPAFAMQCRLGDDTVVLRKPQVEPAESEMLALSVAFGDEPHTLRFARSPRFPDLDKMWDSRADVPDAILLATVEKECGSLFQMLENAVRKQMRLVGLEDVSHGVAESPSIAFEVVLPADQTQDCLTVVLTRSATVVSALGALRNLDLSHESIRSLALDSEMEYAAFAMQNDDFASIASGDAVLLPEIGSVEPKLVVGGRFVLDANGVAPYAEDALVHVRAAEIRPVSLGEVFDAVETPIARPAAAIEAQLRLARNGRKVAEGRLDRLGDQFAFVVEATSNLPTT